MIPTRSANWPPDCLDETPAMRTWFGCVSGEGPTIRLRSLRRERATRRERLTAQEAFARLLSRPPSHLAGTPSMRTDLVSTDADAALHPTVSV